MPKAEKEMSLAHCTNLFKCNIEYKNIMFCVFDQIILKLLLKLLKAKGLKIKALKCWFQLIQKLSETMCFISLKSIWAEMDACEGVKKMEASQQYLCYVIDIFCVCECVYWNSSTTRVTVSHFLELKETKNRVKAWKCMLEHADLELSFISENPRPAFFECNY